MQHKNKIIKSDDNLVFFRKKKKKINEFVLFMLLLYITIASGSALLLQISKYLSHWPNNLLFILGILIRKMRRKTVFK